MREAAGAGRGGGARTVEESAVPRGRAGFVMYWGRWGREDLDPGRAMPCVEAERKWQVWRTACARDMIFGQW